jgi:predicted amidohydrolase YtcJ
MPGLIESHGHLFGLGQSQLGLNLSGLKTKQAALERISEYALSLQEEQMKAGQEEAFRNGITTFHDLAFPSNRLFIYKGNSKLINTPA